MKQQLVECRGGAGKNIRSGKKPTNRDKETDTPIARAKRLLLCCGSNGRDDA